LLMIGKLCNNVDRSEICSWTCAQDFCNNLSAATIERCDQMWILPERRLIYDYLVLTKICQQNPSR
jgi:hypothetical protein